MEVQTMHRWRRIILSISTALLILSAPGASFSSSFAQSPVAADAVGQIVPCPPGGTAAGDAAPYAAEEVTVEAGAVTLAGTLTLPRNPGPHPAVVLISGSGAQDRNEESAALPGYQPFRIIADCLTRQGIAVLRYDDRGTGSSTGDHLHATSADFADDAEAVLAYLRHRPEIDPAQVGLLGHSEGTLIGAMIAARNPAVAFFIALGATAHDGYAILLEQTADMLRAAGADDATVAAQVAKTQRALDLILAEEWDALEAMLMEETMAQLAALPAAQKDAIGDLEAYAAEQVAQSMAQNQGWMRFFITHDPAADWAQIDVPVLVVLGGLDTQVDQEKAQASLQAAFDAAGNPDATITTFDQANHLFQAAQTGAPAEYAELPNEFVSGFLTTLSEWLLTRVETGWEDEMSKLAALDAAVEAEMARLDVPGATVAVVKDGRVLYAKGFGVANVESQSPVTPDMLFRIGSTTKTFTALALAILAENGQVDLDAPIGDYIDGLDAQLAARTGDQLLTHSAGLIDEGPAYGPRDPAALAATAASWTAASHIFTTPDQVFSYSNPGYALAGLLLEAAGDAPYAQQIDALILQPVGMSRSTFDPTLAMTYPFVQGHAPLPDGTLGVVRPYPDHAGYWPAGFMISNVEEMARFAIAMLDSGMLAGKQVLPAGAIEAVSAPHIEVKSGTHYGYGLFRYAQRGVEIVEHAGGIPGFTSLFKLIPEHDFAIIVLANRSGAIFSDSAMQAMELLLPLEPVAEAEATAPTLDAERLAIYTGVYAQVSAQPFEVAVDNGQLIVSASGLSMPLTPTGPDTFSVEMPGLSEPIGVGFVRDASGDIQFMTLGNRAYAKQP